MKVECTLEEFFYGCRKPIEFERYELSKDHKYEIVTNVHRVIEVRPGMFANDEELRFPGEGHIRFGQ